LPKTLDVHLTTNKIKNTVISHYKFTVYLHAYAKQTTPMLISGPAELVSVQLFLKFLGALVRTNLVSHSQHSVYSLNFVLMWTRVENPASQTRVDITI